MNPDHAIIVYRSQTEANTDYFINEMLMPWIYEHWLIVLICVLAVFLYAVIANKKS